MEIANGETATLLLNEVKRLRKLVDSAKEIMESYGYDKINGFPRADAAGGSPARAWLKELEESK